MKVARLWPLSWILVIPLISLLGIWMIGTAELYRELALRNLGDERLGGMTLHKAGDLQFRYLMQSLRRGAIRSVTRGHEEPLPRIHLFAQDADLAALDEHRPRSGQQYMPARIYQPGKDGNDRDFSRIQIRYRGDFAVHWGLFKRSFRVKTKRSDLFHGLRRFNLITPKNEVLYQNHAGYEMARLLGVMAPRSEMVNLNLNGKDRGVHLFVEQISETTLRDLDRMPGDIYSGDELYGLEVWDGIDLKLFDSAGFWNKVAVNNHYPEQHKAPLKALLDALHRRDTKRLESLIDLDAFARFNLWEQLAVSSHTDDTHNWRLYYDPGRGRFYPILWDGIPWAMYFVPADLYIWQPPDQIIASSLMGALFESPRFQNIRRRV
ncbi:MAG: CotH kinase family protein, partial [Proteobacteria bacterium]|nr:CotH kinase family protein [Pseudomonadota bacterium]